MNIARLVFQFCLRQADNVLFVVALLAVGIGCAMERPSLGLIVPGGVVLVLVVLAWVMRSVVKGDSHARLHVSEADEPDTGR